MVLRVKVMASLCVSPPPPIVQIQNIFTYYHLGQEKQ